MSYFHELYLLPDTPEIQIVPEQKLSFLFRDGIFSYSRGATRSCTRLCMPLLYLTRTTYRLTYLNIRSVQPVCSRVFPIGDSPKQRSQSVTLYSCQVPLPESPSLLCISFMSVILTQCFVNYKSIFDEKNALL